MDLRLPDMNGLDAIREIRRESPDARIVVLTALHGSDDIRAALNAGAASYIFKETASSELVRILRDVHAGKIVVPQDVEALRREQEMSFGLTPREREIVELMAMGLRNKEIADALGISPHTSVAHLKKIFAKLKVHDRTAAVTQALKTRIIRLDDEES